MPIVTISQQIGSGGAEVALAVAERLGYCFVDHQRFLEGARGYGLDADRLWHLEEERPSLFERFDGETRRYIAVIQAVLFEIAAEDRAVVIGRGGQWLLRDVPHVLRVRLVAPVEFRVTELVETFSAHGGERLSAHGAAQIVQRDDAQKLKRMRYLFDVDLNDPGLYHLVLNTGWLGPRAAVDLIAATVQQPAFATSESGRQILADHALASKVEVALAGRAETRRYHVEVHAEHGIVTLIGPPVALGAAEAAARTVPGVREIKASSVEIPPMPPFVA
jgi:cytidylate kinase